MHAYLVVGPDPEETVLQAKTLAKTIAQVTYEFSITKIDEVRKLSHFTKLSVEKPTSIVITDIDSAGDEALNAFLKNLEEPQKNLSYILTASSEEKLIPTIVSRCQVIRVAGNRQTVTHDEKLSQFLDMSIGEKFAYLDKIKKRDEAIVFMTDLLHLWHNLLIKRSDNFKVLSLALKVAQKTFINLKANGNVNLQLTNFAIQLGLPERKI